MKKMFGAACLVAIAALLSASAAWAGTVRMKLGHNLAEDHPTSQALVFFKDKVEKDSDRGVRVQLFMNGTLGSEPEVIQQLQNGAVDMTRVSSSALENFNPIFKVFALPYLFTSTDNFYSVLTGPLADKVYTATEPDGYIGLTFFDSGSRSFYSKTKAINTPADLAGQKLRVMDSQTAIKMVQMMGGTPTPMAYGEIYAALQQGVIDGAENNVTALTLGRHGEVVKYYSLDEHNMIPDFLIISTKTWAKLSPEQQKIVKDAAVAATVFHRDLWTKAVAEAEAKAQEMGVTINRPDKTPFIEITKPLYEEYAKDALTAEMVSAIRATQK